MSWLNKLGIAAIAIAVGVTPAVPQGFGPGGGFTHWGQILTQSAPPACSSTPIAYLSTQTSTTDSDTYTFSDIPIGDPPCGSNFRIILAQTMCHSVTASGGTKVLTLGGSAMTVSGNNLAQSGNGNIYTLSVSSGTTATFVYTRAGSADNTCERFAMMLYTIITSSETFVDNVADSNATGGYDLSNVATTSGGGVWVGYMGYGTGSVCTTTLDTAFNGSETFSDNVNAALESNIHYQSAGFTADGTGTTDDFADICGVAPTQAFAVATSYEPPA